MRYTSFRVTCVGSKELILLSNLSEICLFVTCVPFLFSLHHAQKLEDCNHFFLLSDGMELWYCTRALRPSETTKPVWKGPTHMLEWPSSLCNSGYVSSTGQWNRCSDPNPCEPQTPSLCKAISRAQLAGTVQEIDIYQLPCLHNSKTIGDINSKTCIQVKPI